MQVHSFRHVLADAKQETKGHRGTTLSPAQNELL